MLTALLVGSGMLLGLPLGALAEMLLPLASAATLIALIFSILLYLKSLAAPVEDLAPVGSSGERGQPHRGWREADGEVFDGPCTHTPYSPGNPIYDFFMGRELNPRIGSFDFKYFCELRPGLIGWVCWACEAGPRARSGTQNPIRQKYIPQRWPSRVHVS